MKAVQYILDFVDEMNAESNHTFSAEVFEKLHEAQAEVDAVKARDQKLRELVELYKNRPEYSSEGQAILRGVARAVEQILEGK